MKAWKRHQLAWLDEAGWREQLADDACCHDAAGRGALRHWAAHDLPLVVTRQDPAAAPGALSLGLAAPARWERRRLSVTTQAAHVCRRGEFPPAAAVAPLLPATACAAWLACCAGFDALGLAVRVHGSWGWQVLSSLDCLHAGSDLDLLLHCGSPAQADAAVALLGAAPGILPRLDGELVFQDGGAIAWREWAAWRAGRTAQVLVKRLAGVALEHPAPGVEAAA